MKLFAAVAILLVGSSAMAADPAPRWKVNPAASAVSYTVIHPMHTVIGVSKALRGEFAWDPAATEPTAVKGIYLQVDWASFDSGNANRDCNVLKVVDAARFPTLTYRLESLTRRGDQATIDGWLYVKGKKARLSAPAEVRTQNSRLEASTRMTTRMTDFGIDPPSLLFIPVDDNVTFEVRLAAEQVGGGEGPAEQPAP